MANYGNAAALGEAGTISLLLDSYAHRMLFSRYSSPDEHTFVSDETTRPNTSRSGSDQLSTGLAVVEVTSGSGAHREPLVYGRRVESDRRLSTAHG